MKLINKNNSNSLPTFTSIYIENVLPEIYNPIIIMQDDMVIDYHITSPEMVDKDAIFIGTIQKYFASTGSFVIKINQEKGFLPISSCFKQFPNLNSENAAGYEGFYVVVQQVSGGKLNKNVKYTANIVLQNFWFCIFPFTKYNRVLDVSHKIMANSRRTSLKQNLSNKYSFKYKTIVRSIWKEMDEDEVWNSEIISDLEKAWNVIRADAENLIQNQKEGLVFRPDRCLEIVLDYIFIYSRDPNTRNFEIVARDRQTYNNVKTLIRQQRNILKSINVKVVLNSTLSPSPISKILNILSRKFITKEGVGISIDQGEAGTLIDINSIKYKDSSNGLSINTQINLLALRHIFRIIKLRSISGIIIIDLINLDDCDKELEVNMIIDEVYKLSKLDNHRIHVGRLDPLFVLPITRARKKTDLSNIVLSQVESKFNIEVRERINWLIFTHIYPILHSKYKELEIHCSKTIHSFLHNNKVYLNKLAQLSKVISYHVLHNVDEDYIDIK